MHKREAEIEIASSYNTLSLIRSFARTYFDVENISEGDKIKLVSVIDELTTNVIEHAYAGEILIRCGSSFRSEGEPR